MEPKRRSLVPVLVAGAIGAAGSIAMFYGPVPTAARSATSTAVKSAVAEPVCDRVIRRSDAQRLVRSLLESEPICEAPRYFALKERINARIEKLKSTGELSSVSVYTRDFRNGGWIVVGDSAAYKPGRLMSVPTVMAALSVGENEPGFLQRSVNCEGTSAGATCTINELVHRSILEQDDNARLTLERVIPPEGMAQMLNDLALPSPEPASITILEYARVLRGLMNAGSLGPSDCDKVIDLLASTAAKSGLPAGVPGDVTVAHMTSEATVDGGYELHDAGIVFGPQGPYILTIMTRGPKNEKLPGIISELSRMVYEEMKAARLSGV